MQNTQNSPSFSLNSVDLKKLGEKFLIYLVGAIVAYCAVYYTQINWVIGNVNLNAVLIPIFGLVIDSVNTWVKDNGGTIAS